MSDRKGKLKWLKWLFVLLSLLLIFYSKFYSVLYSVDNNRWVTLSILLLAIVLWFTEAVPVIITSMIVIVLFPLFQIITFESAAKGLGNEIIWLIISMLMMGIAVKKTNLDKRIAFFILSLSNEKVRFIQLNFIVLSFVLTFIIPNAIGRLVVLLPIGLSIIHAFEEQVEKNFSKSIILIITFTPYISATSLLTGAGGSIYSASLFSTMLHYEWSYLHWMIMMMPITFFTLGVLWLLIQWLFPVKTTIIHNMKEYLLKEKTKLGALSSSELKLLFMYIVLILLWITKDIHGMSISMSAVLVSIFLYLPGFRIIEWEDAKKELDWGIPLLFSAGFTIAHALKESTVIDWLSMVVDINLSMMPIIIVPIIIMLLFVLIRMFFTNYTSMATALMPVALTFSISSPYNPVWLGMIAVVASSTSFLFPSQSVGNMTSYSLGFYKGRDMFVLGIWLTISIIAITLLVAFLYWPIVGVDIN